MTHKELLFVFGGPEALYVDFLDRGRGFLGRCLESDDGVVKSIARWSFDKIEEMMTDSHPDMDLDPDAESTYFKRRKH